MFALDHFVPNTIILKQCSKLTLHLLFIDSEKAFDKVNRMHIWSALRRRCILGKLIATIRVTG